MKNQRPRWGGGGWLLHLSSDHMRTSLPPTRVASPWPLPEWGRRFPPSGPPGNGQRQTPRPPPPPAAATQTEEHRINTLNPVRIQKKLSSRRDHYPKNHGVVNSRQKIPGVMLGGGGRGPPPAAAAQTDKHQDLNGHAQAGKDRRSTAATLRRTRPNQAPSRSRRRFIMIILMTHPLPVVHRRALRVVQSDHAE
jgi:hypothetical protein